jgi:predicted aspartyl protease
MRTLLLVFLAMLASTAPALADESCQLVQVAKFNMTITGDGRVNVPMTIGNRDVNLLVDTGAAISTLTETTVATFGFIPEKSRFSFRMYGGGELTKFVFVHNVSLGGMRASEVGFFVMPDMAGTPVLGGFMGADVLQNFDVEFDFAHSALNWFSKKHCPERVVYWTHDPYARVKFELDSGRHVVFPVQLDGHEVEATIDTGAEWTVADLGNIESEFDIDEKNPDLKPASGTDERMHALHYPFKTLTLDGVAIGNPDLLLVPRDVSHIHGPTLTLGMNVLRRLHLYIAYGENTLFATSATAH